MKIILRMIAALTITISGLTMAHANSSAATAENLVFSAEQVSMFAKKVERNLASRGARVFLISRVGRPPAELPKGINYTHTAFAVYSQIPTQDGRVIPGYTIYNLYQKDGQPNASHLVTDFPVDFFMGAKQLKAGVVIPVPKLQQELLRVIGSENYMALHNSQYSAVSNPFTQKFQNCTEFVLDVLNSAIYDVEDVDTLKRHSKTYFTPQPINVSPVKLWLGSIFKSDIAVSDHQGPVATATFTSIANYLEKYDLVEDRFVITVGK